MQKRCYNLVLFGGGLDSVCLSEYLRKTQKSFDLVHINYGQKAWVGENQSATYFAEKFNCKLISLSTNAYANSNNPILNNEMAIEHKDNVLHLRNQILFDITTIYAVENLYKNIYVGFHKEPTDSQFYDAMPKFLFAYNKLLEVQKVPVTILAPLSNVEQQSYINYTDKQLLTKSFSCYESNTTTECGQCTHCKHKAKLLESRNAN